MKLIDTHFHLDYYKDHEFWFNKINELEQYTLCVTNSPEVYYSCKKLYKETKYVKFALGFNPQVAEEFEFKPEVFSRLSDTTRYIGEVGLDFSKKFLSTKTLQETAFSYFCQSIAHQNKILTVHTRNAEERTLDIMRANQVGTAIIHWYTGSIKDMYAFLDQGYYFSVNANMCNSQKGCEIVRHIPMDRILIESDGPFTKVNSKKYTPLMLCDVYERVSALKGCNDFEKCIRENFLSLLTN